MLRILSRLFSFLPWSVIYAISSVLAFVLSWGYRRQLVERNLELALPDISLADRRRIRRDCYQNLTDVLLETLKGAHMSREEVFDRVKVIPTEGLRKLQEHGGRFLLYASHHCNWEWGALAVGLEVAPVDPIYKPLRSASADQWMRAYRSRFGNQPIPHEQIGLSLRKLTAKRGLAVVADQAPSKSNSGKVWASFFGVKTPFYKGVFALPFLMQAPVFYASVRRKARGRYEVAIDFMGAPPFEKRERSMLSRYIDYSEREILVDPANWLWTHNRWKYEQQGNEEFLIFQQ